MFDVQNIAKSIYKEQPVYEFSVCTLVTRKEEYNEMLTSFINKGFDTSICEFLFADNSEGNKFDAYSAINLFLRQATGKYIILCHQDILLHKDGVDELRLILKNLDEKDANWGVCGNAGAVGPNFIVYHITYPDSQFLSKGKLPQKVHSLDENFLLVKNDAFLKVSNNLTGFHFYGTDLVLQAELNGYNSYVIPFNLIHKSKGNISADFFQSKKALANKYSHFFRGRWIQTSITVLYLSGTFFGKLMDNPIFLFITRMRNGLKKRLKYDS